VKRTAFTRSKALARSASKLARSHRLRRVGKRGEADREAIERVRPLVLERAGHRCERCGKEGRLDLHHRLARSQGGGHEASNLAALCSGPSGCHRRAHAHLIADWRDWIVQAVRA
jgi:5-methylcytosine-specific restriction endonuclease McrA